MPGWRAYYIAILRENQAADFDQIVIDAWELVSTNASVVSLVVAKYAWLLVDEYQDLSGPLHAIVRTLHAAGSKVFVVGDPDQSIFGFTGATPQYLESWVTAPNALVVRLPFNYRAGDALILAAHATLGAEPGERRYLPDPRREDMGEVVLLEVEGGIDAQADNIASAVVPSLVAAGVPLHEIAVLYRQRGQVESAVRRSLVSAEFPVVDDLGSSWPDGHAVRWLQSLAAWGLGEGVASGSTLESVCREYESSIMAPAMGGNDRALSVIGGLYRVGHAARASQSLLAWLRLAFDELDLMGVAEGRTDESRQVADDLRVLMESAEEQPELGVEAFARRGRPLNRLVLGTYHAAKGREFDAVILPGLQDSLVPRASWNAMRRERYWVRGSVAEDRRTFYVGLTRARRYAFLLWSPTFRNERGYLDDSGPSRFVSEVADRLQSERITTEWRG